MRDENIVITGGSGFVGQHLIREASRRWPEARLIIWDKRGKNDSLGASYFEVDLTDREQVARRLVEDQPVWVVHLAAIAAVPAALKDPELVRRVNTDATRKLLEAAAEQSPSTRFLVASTADIYGSAPEVAGQGAEALLAEMPLTWAKPQNPYAQSKWEMEKIIEEKFNDRVVRARPFPHIGPGQGLGFVTADFASQVAKAEAGDGEAVVRVGNLDAKRDFTDVRDVARAYCLLMEKGRAGNAYHIASGRAVGIKWVLDYFLKLAGRKIEVRQDPERLRPSDVPILLGDAAKIKKETGWEPEIKLEQSLEDVLNWWREVYIMHMSSNG